MPSQGPNPALPGGTLVIRHALLPDLPDIVRIENASFTSPWPEWSLREEMMRDDSVFLVAQIDGQTVGYAGMWLYVEEAHVGTIAVDTRWRQRGIGMALMLALLDIARREKAILALLEYRVSNLAAANLYAQLGFRHNRIRWGYYQDTGEDAVEAILEDLQGCECAARLAGIREDWEQRHGACVIECD